MAREIVCLSREFDAVCVSVWVFLTVSSVPVCETFTVFDRSAHAKEKCFIYRQKSSVALGKHKTKKTDEFTFSFSRSHTERKKTVSFAFISLTRSLHSWFNDTNKLFHSFNKLNHQLHMLILSFLFSLAFSLFLNSFSFLFIHHSIRFFNQCLDLFRTQNTML